MPSHLTFLFVCAFLAVDSAIASPIPALMRPSGPASHWQVTLQEWSFLCIFASALLFSVIGTFVLTTFAHARASSFTNGLSTTSQCPFRQLYVLRLRVPSPFTAAPGGGRGASRRSRVAMRRGVAYPIAAGRRWYQA